MAPGKLLVVGLGNLLLGDDGVGIHAIRQLEGRLPKRVVRAEAGTAVLDALHLVERAGRIIALDAVATGAAPGSIHLMDARGARRPEGDSLHGVNLLSVLNFLPGHHPEVVILGSEPAAVGFSMELSESVQASLPILVAAAARLAALWQQKPHLTATELCSEVALGN